MADSEVAMLTGKERPLSEKLQAAEEYVPEKEEISAFEAFGASYNRNLSEALEVMSAEVARNQRGERSYISNMFGIQASPVQKSELIDPNELNTTFGVDFFKTPMARDTAAFMVGNMRYRQKQLDVEKNYEGPKVFGQSIAGFAGEIAGGIMPQNIIPNLATGFGSSMSKVFLSNLAGNILTEGALLQASQQTGVERNLGESAKSATVGALAGTALHLGISKLAEISGVFPKEELTRVSDDIKKKAETLRDVLKDKYYDYMGHPEVLDAVSESAENLFNNGRGPNLDRLAVLMAREDYTIKEGVEDILPNEQIEGQKYIAYGEDIVDTRPKDTISEALSVSEGSKSSGVVKVKPYEWNDIKQVQATHENPDSAFVFTDKNGDTFYTRNANVVNAEAVRFVDVENSLKNLDSDYARELHENQTIKLDGDLNPLAHGEVIGVVKKENYKRVPNTNRENKLREMDSFENDIGYDKNIHDEYNNSSSEFTKKYGDMPIEKELANRLKELEEPVIEGLETETSKVSKAINEDMKKDATYDSIFKALTVCIKKFGV